MEANYFCLFIFLHKIDKKLEVNSLEISSIRPQICYSNFWVSLGSTCALRTALSWPASWSITRCWWADQGHTGDGASDTSAALAGVGGGCEGVTVRVDDTLIQTGVTDGAAGIPRGWMGALHWAGSLLTVHHLILIRGGDEGTKWNHTIWIWIMHTVRWFLLHSVRMVRLTRQEHDEQGSEGEAKE